MNNKQFDRWKEFARAMCFGGYPGITEKRKGRLWQETERFINHYKDEPVDGWDNEYCLCDSFHEWFDDYLTDIMLPGEWGDYKDAPHYFYNQLNCIIRASIDAVTGGCGVLGWTAGDLRQMFNGRVPRWVSWRYKRFATIPDEKQLWL